jgi:hypothetical protein
VGVGVELVRAVVVDVVPTDELDETGVVED